MDAYRFSERTAGGELDDRTRDWLAAVRLGFNEGRGSDETTRRWWAAASADGQRWRSVHRDQPLDELGMGSLPVATLGSLDHRINVGGQLVTARYITDVTVRTTDRRKGLLRRMMADELTQTRADGRPVASLTASEAGIYGRFGFGVALRRQSVEVALDGRFQLRHEPRATVEAADPSTASGLVADLLEDFLARHRGAHEPMAHHRVGWSGEYDWEKQAEATSLRAAIALDGTRPVGAVVFTLGDESDKLTVQWMVADGDAELALWQYLTNIDLVTKAVVHQFSPASALREALVDHRLVRTTGESDQIWLRILDVAEMLRVRGWDHDGSIVLAVDDPLGITPGTWRVTVSDGHARVEQLSDSPEEERAEARMGIDVLGELYFGAGRVPALVAAQRITAAPEAARALAHLFAVDEPARNVVLF